MEYNVTTLSYSKTQHEQSLVNACRILIENKEIKSQVQLKNLLIDKGFVHVSQSLVSRLLSDLGVIKTTNSKGQKIYKFSSSESILLIGKSLEFHIKSISHNQSCIIIQTEDGCANAIGQIIKINFKEIILGCISGFDSLMIIPAKNITLQQCMMEIIKSLRLDDFKLDIE